MKEDGAVPTQGGPPLGESARRPAYVPPALEVDTEARQDPSERAPYTSWSEQELAEALRSRVAGIGLAGPAQDGPERIRHAVRVRRRNRQALVGSAAVLLVAVVVFLTGGDRFPLTPTLTGAGGAGNGAVSSGASDGSGPQGSATAAGTAHIVFPSPGDHRTGPAIGPVPAATSVPASAHSASPLCSSSMLTTQITLGPTVNGITYGHVDATAQTGCVAVGPPSLTISNQASTAAATVVLLKEDVGTAPGLPSVGTWGATLTLSAGQSLEFQFAWLPLPCAQAGSSASAGGSVPAATTPDPADTVYSLGYIPSGTQSSPTNTTLNAQCGADVFVTDIYQPGSQPLPSAPPPPASTPGQPAVSADPSPSGGDDAASGSASPSASASASPAPSSSSVTADGSAVVTSNAAPGPKPSG